MEVSYIKTGIYVPPLKNNILGGVFSTNYDDDLRTLTTNSFFRDHFTDFLAPTHLGYKVSIVELKHHTRAQEAIASYRDKIFVTADLVNTLILKRLFPEGFGEDLLPKDDRESIFFVKDSIGIPRIITVGFAGKLCVLSSYPVDKIRPFRRKSFLFIAL